MDVIVRAGTGRRRVQSRGTAPMRSRGSGAAPRPYSFRITAAGATRAAAQPGNTAIRLPTASVAGTMSAMTFVGTTDGEAAPIAEDTRLHAHRPPSTPSGIPTAMATTEND